MKTYKNRHLLSRVIQKIECSRLSILKVVREVEYEAIKDFSGKRVKLVYHNGFNLQGNILKVYKDTIFFKTKQAESLINIDDIRSVRTIGSREWSSI